MSDGESIVKEIKIQRDYFSRIDDKLTLSSPSLIVLLRGFWVFFVESCLKP